MTCQHTEEGNGIRRRRHVDHRQHTVLRADSDMDVRGAQATMLAGAAKLPDLLLARRMAWEGRLIG